MPCEVLSPEITGGDGIPVGSGVCRCLMKLVHVDCVSALYVD